MNYSNIKNVLNTFVDFFVFFYIFTRKNIKKIFFNLFTSFYRLDVSEEFIDFFNI